MNTREKIITLDEARARLAVLRVPPTLVVGYFDPLLAVHAEALDALARPVWVALTDPPSPIYSSAARLELVAALRSVSQVFACPDDVELRNAVDLRDEHLAIRERFTELVRERHK